MKTTVRALVFALLLPVVSSAQVQDSINGGWAAATPEGAEQSPVQLSLTEGENGALSGSVILPGGVELSVQEGTIAAAMVQFKTAQQDGGKTVVLKWLGTVKGNEIAFTRAADGGAGATDEIVVTRVKK
jgi:hypothetical protein